MATKCKAKNPYYCPYHSKAELKDFKESVSYWENELNKAHSFDNYQDIAKEIATAKARIDANEYGFKALVKELAKARREGDTAKSAELANRLQKAAEARLKDGVKGEWDDSFENFFAFGSKVLEEAEKTDDVRIPFGLSGTQNILMLYKRMISEGHEVVAVKAHDVRHDDFEGEKAEEFFQELKAREKDIYNGEVQDIWKTVFEDGQKFLRGLTFVKDGRTITVSQRSTEEEFSNRFDV